MPDFTTDGCTGFPDGWWLKCCILHDQLYWWRPDGISKVDADQAMTDCMTALGAPGFALVAAIGLTIFGWRYWRRGRRGTPGTEPKLLAEWLAKRKQGKDKNNA